MAFTQTQLDALDTAIAGGTLTVEYDGKRITYRSLSEMLKLRDMMRSELGVTSTTTRTNLTEYDPSC
jgi:hypothetical protein